MTLATAAATARVLLLVDAVSRTGTRRVSDLDLTRLAYFVDAFSPLWRLEPLDRYRLKVTEVRSRTVRRAVTRLVLGGVIEPSMVTVVDQPRPHLTATYRLLPDRADPVLRAVMATATGRREAALVEEVVYAAAGMLDGSLAEAVTHDAGFSDPTLGPLDVIDLARPHRGTTAAAERFRGGASSHALVEAELTHLYMAHLERVIRRA